MYPTSWAQEVANMIKTLAEGENYLDVIRRRITEMGNSLGFVRMIKNASLKDNQNLLAYLPKTLDTIKFEDIANDLAIGGEVLESMKMFDETVRLVVKQGDDANDFMRKIVSNNEGFADGKEALAPLKNFHMLIPAVSIAFIEHLVVGRNKIKQRDIQDGFISDDGFALGVAFLLRVLGIHEEFNSLNWFDSIEIKLKKDIEQAKQKQERVALMAQERKKAHVAYGDDDDIAQEQLSVRQKENEMTEF